MVKAEEREARVDMEDMKKEKEGCLSMGASAGGPTIFTPRSFQPDVAVPTLNSFPLPTMSPSPSPPHSPPSYVWIPSPPLHILLLISTLWPDTWTPVADLWRV